MESEREWPLVSRTQSCPRSTRTKTGGCREERSPGWNPPGSAAVAAVVHVVAVVLVGALWERECVGGLRVEEKGRKGGSL